MKKALLLLFFLLPAFLKAGDSIHVALGVPTPKMPMTINVLEKNEYWSGFSCEYEVPLWVSYELNKNWYGDVARWSGNFIVDSTLPSNCWVKHSDYTNSGYDRGHMVRSEERTRTVDENKSTFKTSNIIPQLAELNQQTWLKLEYYCESLAKDSLKEMFIIDGPVFSTLPVKLYNNKIGIPDSCYKIIVVLNQVQTIKDITAKTQIIACMFPNNDKEVKNHDWQTYKTTVRNIENQTKLNFFSNLSQSLQDQLENLTVGVEESINNKISIYPNPTASILNIKGILGEIKIVDILGNEILTSSSNQINVESLNTGIYYIYNNSIIIGKFIKI